MKKQTQKESTGGNSKIFRNQVTLLIKQIEAKQHTLEKALRKYLTQCRNQQKNRIHKKTAATTGKKATPKKTKKITVDSFLHSQSKLLTNYSTLRSSVENYLLRKQNLSDDMQKTITSFKELTATPLDKHFNLEEFLTSLNFIAPDPSASPRIASTAALPASPSPRNPSTANTLLHSETKIQDNPEQTPPARSSLTVEQIQQKINDYHAQKGMFRKLAGLLFCCFSASAGRTQTVSAIEGFLGGKTGKLSQENETELSTLLADQNDRRKKSAEKHSFFSHYVLKRDLNDSGATTTLLKELQNNLPSSAPVA